jgi:hypothetical protein
LREQEVLDIVLIQSSDRPEYPPSNNDGVSPLTMEVAESYVYMGDVEPFQATCIEWAMLAAGPIVKPTKFTQAFRIVLKWVFAKEEFVVHHQFFPNFKHGSVNMGNSYFEHGQYSKDFYLALGYFIETCKKNYGSWD